MHQAHTYTLLRTHAIALGIYTVLACILTWPLLLHLNTHLPAIPGELGQDVWQNAWNILWVRQALLVEHTNPFHTMMLFYPQGASLSLHTLNLPLGIIGMPLLSLTNIVVTYNILTLLALVLAGYCSFLLGWFLCKDKPAALVAGAIVICSPYRLFELRGAQLPTLSDYAVPLAVLAVLVALQRQTWRSAVLVGGLLLLAGLSSWYHLFHLLLALPCIGVWRAIGFWRTRNLALVQQDARVWLKIAASSVLVLAPFAFPVAIESLTTSYGWKGDELVIQADLLHLIPRTGGVWQHVPPDWWEVYLFALVPVLLAVGGIIIVPRQAAMWATLAIVFLVLTPGPWLTINTTPTGIPLPYLLFRWLPVVDTLRAPMRMAFMTTLMLALSAALGLAHVWRTMSYRTRSVIAIGLIVVIMLEAIRLPFPLIDGRVSPFYAQVANEPGHWSVLELPFDRSDREVLEMYQQTHHRKYILTGRLARNVPDVPYRVALPIAQADDADTRPDIVELSPDERDQLLHGLRVRYLVLRDYPGDPLRAGEQLATARQTLGPLTEVYRDEELQAYRLDEVATWLDGAGATSLAEVPLFLGPDKRWGEREMSGYGIIRWLPAEGAGLWVYAQHPRRVVLQLSLYSIAGAGPLEIWLNGEHVQTVPIAGDVALRQYTTGPLALPAGRSLIEVRTSLPGVTPQSRGLGNDVRALTFGIHRVRLVEVGM